MVNANLLSKLVLGTAQFGELYGITNKKKISTTDIKEVLSFSNKKIKFLDTAPDYKGCYKILNSNNIKNFSIITKLPLLISNKIISNKDIDYLVNKSLKALRKNCLDTLLIRTPTQLLRNNYIWKKCMEYKFENKINKIGFTVYNPDELDLLYNEYRPDVVQLPYNIFDRRFEITGWLDKLHENGVEIHARAVFLQGVLLCDYEKLPEKFRPLLNDYFNWINEKKISKLQASLCLLIENKKINKIVVGINSKKDFLDIINTSYIKINYPAWLNNNNSKILQPNTWQ